MSVEERANVASINWALGRWKAFVENSLLGDARRFRRSARGELTLKLTMPVHPDAEWSI